MTDNADFLAVGRQPGGLTPLQFADTALPVYSDLTIEDVGQCGGMY